MSSNDFMILPSVLLSNMLARNNMPSFDTISHATLEASRARLKNRFFEPQSRLFDPELQRRTRFAIWLDQIATELMHEGINASQAKALKEELAAYAKRFASTSSDTEKELARVTNEIISAVDSSISKRPVIAVTNKIKSLPALDDTELSSYRTKLKPALYGIVEIISRYGGWIKREYDDSNLIEDLKLENRKFKLRQESLINDSSLDSIERDLVQNFIETKIQYNKATIALQRNIEAKLEEDQKPDPVVRENLLVDHYRKYIEFKDCIADPNWSATFRETLPWVFPVYDTMLLDSSLELFKSLDQIIHRDFKVPTAKPQLSPNSFKFNMLVWAMRRQKLEAASEREFKALTDTRKQFAENPYWYLARQLPKVKYLLFGETHRTTGSLEFIKNSYLIKQLKQNSYSLALELPRNVVIGDTNSARTLEEAFAEMNRTREIPRDLKDYLAKNLEGATNENEHYNVLFKYLSILDSYTKAGINIYPVDYAYSKEELNADFAAWSRGLVSREECASRDREMFNALRRIPGKVIFYGGQAHTIKWGDQMTGDGLVGLTFRAEKGGTINYDKPVGVRLREKYGQNQVLSVNIDDRGVKEMGFAWGASTSNPEVCKYFKTKEAHLRNDKMVELFHQLYEEDTGIRVKSHYFDEDSAESRIKFDYFIEVEPKPE